MSWRMVFVILVCYVWFRRVVRPQKRSVVLLTLSGPVFLFKSGFLTFARLYLTKQRSNSMQGASSEYIFGPSMPYNVYETKTKTPMCKVRKQQQENIPEFSNFPSRILHQGKLRGFDDLLHFVSLETVRVRFLAERIFRGFLFLGRRIFSRIFSPDFFSSFLWGKSAQKNPPGKSPAKSSKIYTTKIPDAFLQRVRPKNGYHRRFKKKNAIFSMPIPMENQQCAY